MTARRQAALYYARKRRRSLVSSVRLSRTAFIAPGDSLPTPFRADQLSRATTFKTKIDLSVVGELFSFGTSLVVRRTATDVEVDWRGNRIATIPQPLVDADWDLIISLIPSTGQSRVWNQYGEIARDQIANPTFTTIADLGESLSASSSLIENLSVYACQVPRHFHPVMTDEDVVVVDQLLFNLSANFFLPGFNQPNFEP